MPAGIWAGAAAGLGLYKSQVQVVGLPLANRFEQIDVTTWVHGREVVLLLPSFFADWCLYGGASDDQWCRYVFDLLQQIERNGHRVSHIIDTPEGVGKLSGLLQSYRSSFGQTLRCTPVRYDPVVFGHSFVSYFVEALGLPAKALQRDYYNYLRSAASTLAGYRDQKTRWLHDLLTNHAVVDNATAAAGIENMVKGGEFLAETAHRGLVRRWELAQMRLREAMGSVEQVEPGFLLLADGDRLPRNSAYSPNDLIPFLGDLEFSVFVVPDEGSGWTAFFAQGAQEKIRRQLSSSDLERPEAEFWAFLVGSDELDAQYNVDHLGPDIVRTAMNKLAALMKQ